MEDCIFCKIASKESPAKIEYEDENVIAFENINAVAEFHILIVPKKHTGTFMDLGEDILPMTKAVQSLIKEKKLQGGYKLVFNGGSYQKIPHVHWHLLGGQLKDHNDILNQT